MKTTTWTALEDLAVPTKSKIKVQCKCGAIHNVRVKDLLYGGSKRCRRCADLDLTGKLHTKEHYVQIGTRGALTNKTQREAFWGDCVSIYGMEAIHRLQSNLSSAKSRCNNPNQTGYMNYGGRGIEFRFNTVTEGVMWVLSNIGDRPTEKHSLDRIDNNRHYEPGNLRWATRTEQRNNQRVRRLCEKGKRIRKLQNFRPDVTYECIRHWIDLGFTDEEIISKVKWGKYESASI